MREKKAMVIGFMIILFSIWMIYSRDITSTVVSTLALGPIAYIVWKNLWPKANKP